VDANRKFFADDRAGGAGQGGEVVILYPVFYKGVGRLQEEVGVGQVNGLKVAEPGVEYLRVYLAFKGSKNSVPELLCFHFAFISEALGHRGGSLGGYGLHTGFSTPVEKPVYALKTTAYATNIGHFWSQYDNSVDLWKQLRKVPS